jgi:hypothetical protein
MEKLILALIATTLVILASQIPAIAQNPVVVELFTSEGCSSCPPADAVLFQLSRQQAANGAELILLAEHVDYWNYIGWTDRFSSKQFSERQSQYAAALHSQVYTPQMVIDGQDAFVGNDAGEVQSRITAAAHKPKPAQVSLVWAGKDRLRVIVKSASTEKAEVLLATTEDDLSTQVANGENEGKTLHHAAVVRQLRKIGEVANGKFDQTVEIARQSDWNSGKLKLAVLAQDPKTERILGAAVLPYQQ